jgi:predicted NACHT family NTPase
MGDSAHQILLNEVLTLGNRIVITGGPGSGKTTVLSYIGWVLAKALLDQKPVFAQKNVGVTTPLPIPVYLPLSRYAAHVKACRLEKSSGIRPTISQYIPHYLEEMEVTLGDNFNFFQELLDKKTKILLLLDGLDEVPNKDDRALVT